MGVRSIRRIRQRAVVVIRAMASLIRLEKIRPRSRMRAVFLGVRVNISRLLVAII